MLSAIGAEPGTLQLAQILAGGGARVDIDDKLKKANLEGIHFTLQADAAIWHFMEQDNLEAGKIQCVEYTPSLT